MVLPATRQQHREIFAQDHAGLFVECGEGLVHQQNFGLQGESAGELGALFHAAGKLVREMIREFREAHAL